MQFGNSASHQDRESATRMILGYSECICRGSETHDDDIFPAIYFILKTYMLDEKVSEAFIVL